MRKTLIMTSAYAHPPVQTVGREVGRNDCLWEEAPVFGQISLAGNRMASVAFGKQRFSAGEVTLGPFIREKISRG